MRKFLLTALLALSAALLLCLPALGETCQGEIPAEFAAAFSGSRWAGYTVTAGFTFYPAGGNSGEGTPALSCTMKA